MYEQSPKNPLMVEETKAFYVLGVDNSTSCKNITFYYPKSVSACWYTYKEAIKYRNAARKRGRKMYQLFKLTEIIDEA